MKKQTMLGSLFLLVATLAQATDLSVLTTPSRERDQLEQKYETQIKSNQATPIAFQELGIIYHMKATESESEPQIIKKAHALLKQAYAQNKKDPLTKAYLGSITTMMAITVEAGMEKMKFVKRGTRHLDKAIKDHPDIVDLRMLRGMNSLNLPKFLERARYAVADFQHILKIIPNASNDFKAQLRFNLGKAYELTEAPEKAKIQWQQVIKLAPNSSYAKQAKEKLG